MRVYVYVDGFNFYYGAVKGTPYKWVDFAALSQLLMPRDHVAQIRYFTSRIQPREGDPQQAQRQQAYLRALGTLGPRLSVHYGSFVGDRFREKGSDVNLASHLLLDAAKGHFEVAVVLSNDSDLVTPMRMVRDDFRLPVGLVNPQLGGGKHTSQELLGVATFAKKLSKQKLADSQFPDVLTDANGTIRRPPSW